VPFDAFFARQTPLPLAIHAYTEAGITEDCESLDLGVFKIAGKIQVDQAKCTEVWARVESADGGSREPRRRPGPVPCSRR